MASRRPWRRVGALLGSAWILVIGVLILRSAEIHPLWKAASTVWCGIGLLDMAAIFLDRSQAWERWFRWVYRLGGIGVILVALILMTGLVLRRP